MPAEHKKAMQDIEQELGSALLRWSKQDALQAVQKVEENYAQLPGFRRGLFVELIESIFVITVVFLGIRTYFVQPFRIPTNSM